MLHCPQCNCDMNEVVVRGNPGSLIQLDQCGECGGIWCDKWELFPVEAAEADRLDPLDENLLRDKIKLPQKTLYCPRCADELHIFADPVLPKDIQLMRCRHCDGIWLNRGQFHRYKGFQKGARSTKMDKEAIIATLPEVYANPKSWVLTGTKGIYAYPRGEEAGDEPVKESVAGAVKLILQSLMRMILGI
ncbi:MAG TPA: zf-TFIIB domain-containing protein [Candidatus Binatia bacterium]